MAGILTVGAIFPATVANAKTFPNQNLTMGSLLLAGPVEKTNATGTSAKVTMNDAIYRDDIVTAYVRNKNGIKVTEGDAARFRGTASGTTQSMPYQSGKGKKGNQFYLCLLLGQGSYNTHLTVSCNFVP